MTHSVKALIAVALAASCALAAVLLLGAGGGEGPSESRHVAGSSAGASEGPSTAPLEPPPEDVDDAARVPPSAPAPAKDTGGPPDPVAAPTLDEADIALIQRNVRQLYADADLETVTEAVRDVHARWPGDRIEAVHGAKVDAGEYEVLDAPKAVSGTSIQVPQVEQSEVAFGLVSVRTLDDGTWVKTELDLAELGDDAGIAVEYGAIQQAYADAVRRR